MKKLQKSLNLTIIITVFLALLVAALWLSYLLLSQWWLASVGLWVFGGIMGYSLWIHLLELKHVFIPVKRLKATPTSHPDIVQIKHSQGSSEVDSNLVYKMLLADIDGSGGAILTQSRWVGTIPRSTLDDVRFSCIQAGIVTQSRGNRLYPKYQNAGLMIEEWSRHYDN